MNQKVILFGILLLIAVCVVYFVSFKDKDTSFENAKQTDSKKSTMAITNQISEEKNIVNSKTEELAAPQSLQQDKTFQEAKLLVTEGKDYLKKANAFNESKDEDNAQINFKKALKSFKLAIKKIDTISKSFPGDQQLEALNADAQGMEFFLVKSCIK